MTEYTFDQLVDIAQVRQLLESHHRLSGMAYGLFDADENNLIAVGWQDICVRFHRVNPITSVRCRETNAFLLQAHRHDFEGDYLEHRCGNGMIDVAMPIIISGEHLATLYAGQFFYDDDRPDTAFFRSQAEELGFDIENYLAALERVPIFSREYVRNNICFLGNIVNVLSEMGLKNLRFTREMEERKAAQAMLENERLLLQTLIQTLPDPVWLKDVNGVFLACNAAFGRLFDDTPSGIVGRKDNDYVDDELAAFFQQKDREAIADGQPRTNEEWVTYASDGHRALWETTKTRVCDAQGRVVGALGVARDITERKQMETALRESEQQFRTLTENSPNIIVRYDRECRRVYANPAYSLETGIPSDQAQNAVLAVQWRSDISMPVEEYKAKLRQVMETGIPAEILLEWRRPDTGMISSHVFNVVAERDPDGQVIGCLAIGHNISDRKKAEESLHAKREQLAAVARELSMAEERERLRIASILHDHIGQILLLGRIKLGALAGIPKPAPIASVIAEVIELLDQATDDAHSLTVQLCPPMLSVSGLEAALQWLGRRMESDYGLVVEFSDDLRPKPLGDELNSILYQCARELLINTAKHANTDRAWLIVEREDDMYRLTVEDRGTGFNPDDIAPDITKDCRFGLFSIQVRIEFLGGHMEIESSPGGGARITIRLPVKA